MYYWRIVNRKQDQILKECVKALQEQGVDDPLMRQILEIEKKIRSPITGLKLKELKEKVIERAVILVLDIKREHGS